MSINKVFSLVLGVFAATAIAGPKQISTPPPSVFFVANEGQWDEPFLFKVQAGAATYFVTPEGMTIDVREYERRLDQSRLDELDPFDRHREPEPVSVRGHVLKVNFVGGNLQAAVRGEDKLASYSNYFLGRDSCNWRSRVGHYQRVVMEEAWSGIDVEFRAQPNGVETVYHVKPGADPSQIMIEYEGLDAPLRTDSQGNLILATSLGNLTEKAPWAYQIINNRQQEVRVEFQVISDNRCTLNPQSFDQTKELVIDPLLTYSTYFGGSNGIDSGIKAMTVDHFNRKLVAGETSSSNFPIREGAYQDTLRQVIDCFVSVFSANGEELLYSTFVGGRGQGEGSKDIEIAPDNSIYLLAQGETGWDWPLTPEALDTTGDDDYEGFLVRLSEDGSNLLYSSYLGGSADDFVSDIEFDSIGNLYFSGRTRSTDFQTTESALCPVINNAPFICWFDPVDYQLRYSSGFSDSCGRASLAYLSVHPVSPSEVWLFGAAPIGSMPITEDAFMTECDCEFVGVLARINLIIPNVEFCSYYGAPTRRSEIGDIFFLTDSTMIISGSTNSPDFPVTAGAFDTTYPDNGIAFKAFVSMVRFNGEIIHSTLFGGRVVDNYFDFRKSVINNNGRVWITGRTEESDLPISPDAFDSTHNGIGDIYFTQFTPDLSTLAYSTYIGTSEEDAVFAMTWDLDSTLWLGGITYSLDFPTTPNAFQPNPPQSGVAVLMQWTFPTSVDDPVSPALPAALRLSTFPNPFNNQTMLRLELDVASIPRLHVYNVLGQLVGQRVFPRLQPGTHLIPWNADGLPSGSYVLTITSGRSTVLTKTTLIR